jgi:hypothetical protein
VVSCLHITLCGVMLTHYFMWCHAYTLLYVVLSLHFTSISILLMFITPHNTTVLSSQMQILFINLRILQYKPNYNM